LEPPNGGPAADPENESSMSTQVEALMERDQAAGRHRLAYPAVPAEVAKASQEARRAMRWPMMIAAGLVLLALTGTLAVLVVLRPGASSAALLVCGALLLWQIRRPGRSYDSATGWVYRFGILGGIAGELLSLTLLRAGANPIPSWLSIATDALGVGGAIGLGVALASSSTVVVLTFLYVTTSLRQPRAEGPS
jgi:hypothetical protein